MSARKPVFFDPTGRRRIWVRVLGWSAAIISTLALIAFAVTIFLAHEYETDSTGQTPAVLKPVSTARLAAPQLLKPAESLADEVHAKERAAHAAKMRTIAATMDAGKAKPDLARPDGRALSIGFYVNWDDASFPALQRALPHLDWVVPGWLSLDGADMALKVDMGGNKALDYIRQTQPDMPILPMIQNATEGNWNGPGLAKLLADPQQRAQRIADIVAFLDTNHFQGLTIDFETVPKEAQLDLQAFLQELGAAFKPHGWLIVLAVPFDDNNWDYVKYAGLTDYLLLMAYDEHWEEGEPGPIASQDWFENTLDKRMDQLDPAHTIVAIGGYGYDWVKGQTATDMSFQDAVLAAQDSEADIDFDDKANNPHFTYTEDDGKVHDVWFLDAVTAFNEIHAADIYQPAGYAIWRLGSEDPSLWSVIGRPYGATPPDDLKSIALSEDVAFNGTGEILRVASRPAPGARDLEVDKETGDIDDEAYTQVPTSYVIQRFGAVPHKLALTFDDGPDPTWTPQILDILKAKGVPATFFIVGENAMDYPDLVYRMFDDGHDVGNHSFTHPNIAAISPDVARLELNATQRLFQAITGRSMRLFRPPYLGDAEPTTLDEIIPIDIAQDMGYITVGLKIDPDDWQRPPAQQIIDSVLSQLDDPNPENRGNVVLLHDAGGDRSQTVAALPTLIDDLRARGYEFVTVSTLAGLTRDQAMPPLPEGSVTSWVDRPVFLTLSWTNWLMAVLFLTAIWLGIGRMVVLVVLAVVHRIRFKRPAEITSAGGEPLVSVLIPAFNEAKVIVASVQRLLDSQYRNLEIIVIDDGSSDGTGDLVRDGFAAEPRVTAITVPNGGKANALNRGLKAAQGEIVVALDADTQFKSDTISKLISWFDDTKIGAVAGNAKVGNRVNMVTNWQALEYISAQNLERRALAAVGCVTVVPGAVGAWRRAAVEALGGFPADTLAEDQDMTLAIQRAGYKVWFDPDAIALTEAPETFRGLAKQRFRWAFGTLQCLWKHRSATFSFKHAALGWIAMPQVWLFQILFSLLSPLVDLAVIWQLVKGAIGYMQHGDQWDSRGLVNAATYFAVFVLVDAFTAAVAFLMDRKEKWSLLWWLALQRFGYRQIMYYVVVKSVSRAISGAVVGWGKLERKGSVAGE